MSTKDKIFAVIFAISIFIIIPICCYFISSIFYFISDYFFLYVDFLSIYFDDLSAGLIAVASVVIFVIIIFVVLVEHFSLDDSIGG